MKDNIEKYIVNSYILESLNKVNEEASISYEADVRSRLSDTGSSLKPSFQTLPFHSLSDGELSVGLKL